MMNATPVPALEVRNLSKSFAGDEVLKGVSIAVAKGERRGLIGPNGAGKTTLFNVISGAHRASGGRVQLAGKDIGSLSIHQRARMGLGRTFQIASLFDSLTVLEHVIMGIVAREQGGWLTSLPLHDGDIRREAEGLLESTGLWGVASARPSELSYGHQRVIEIALSLAQKPTVLLLDEPAAGLAANETLRLVNLLESVDKELTLVLIEHDMDVLFGIVDQVTVLDSGTLLAEGDLQSIRSNADVRARYLGRGTA